VIDRAALRGASAAALLLLVASTAIAHLPAGPAPLGYDPEAWLIWGRELHAGMLDVTAGPAIKPLPMLWNALVVSLLGDAAARGIWAVIPIAALIASAMLSWQLVRATGARRGWAAAAASMPIATATLAGGALLGGSEPLVLMLLLLAVRLAARGHWVGALAWLVPAALLRPEALVLAVPVAVMAARSERTTAARQRWVPIAAAAAIVSVVPIVWVALQRAGSGTITGVADAGAALQAGQPGLAARPALASLEAAVGVAPPVLVIPLLVFALWTRSQAPVGGVTSPGASRAAELAGAAGLLWVVTVIAMSELGFSGEARYLAPGVALAGVSLVLWLARAESRATPSPLAAAGAPSRVVARHRAAGAAIGVAGVVAAVMALLPAWHGARSLAGAQRELGVLLRDPAVVRTLPRCAVVSVPRMTRPAVAWRSARPISTLQSPSVDGADCWLAHARRPVVGEPSARVRRASPIAVGRWTWRAAP
jgi:hypothetical protein